MVLDSPFFSVNGSYVTVVCLGRFRRSAIGFLFSPQPRGMRAFHGFTCRNFWHEDFQVQPLGDELEAPIYKMEAR